MLTQGLQMSALIDKVHFYLGEAYLANGEKEKACAQFAKAMERGEIEEADYRARCR